MSRAIVKRIAKRLLSAIPVLVLNITILWAGESFAMFSLLLPDLPRDFDYSADPAYQKLYVESAFRPLGKEIAELNMTCDSQAESSSYKRTIKYLTILKGIDPNTPERGQAQNIIKQIERINADQKAKCWAISIFGSGIPDEKEKIFQLINEAPGKSLTKQQYRQAVDEGLNRAYANLKKKLEAYNDSIQAWELLEDNYFTKLVAVAAASNEKQKIEQQKQEKLKQQKQLKASREEKHRKLVALIKGQEAERIRANLQTSDYALQTVLGKLSLFSGQTSGQTSGQGMHHVIHQAFQLINEGSKFDPFVESIAFSLVDFWEDQQDNRLRVSSITADSGNLKVGEAVLFALVAMIQADGQNASVLLSNPYVNCGLLSFEFDEVTARLLVHTGHQPESGSTIKILFSSKARDAQGTYLFKGVDEATPSGACTASYSAIEAPLLDRAALMAHLDTAGSGKKLDIAESDSCFGSSNDSLCELATFWHQASGPFRQRLLVPFIEKLDLMDRQAQGRKPRQQVVAQACFVLHDSQSIFSDRLALAQLQYSQSSHVLEMIREGSELLKKQCDPPRQEL